MKKIKNHTVFYIAAIICIILLISFCGGSAQKIRAAASESSSIVTAYEQSNVLDDLKGSTIDGKEFNLNDYNFDERKQTQVLNFIEYCYSFYVGKQDDYGLYVYVYNPQGRAFDKSNAQNYVQFRYANSADGYNMYSIKFLNESTAAGYEGLFLKYKVLLSDIQREDILSSLNSAARVYEVSEIGIVDPQEHCYPNPKAFENLATYSYSGYAKGYGSVSAVEDTLMCARTGLTGLNLQVNQTYFHTPYTNGDNSYTKDTLYSCYFAVPTELIEANGEIVEIRAKWLKAMLNWSFVTSNQDFYDFVYTYMGYDVANPTAVNGASQTAGLSKLSDKRIYAPDVYVTSGRTVFDYGQYYDSSLGLGNMGWFAGLYWCDVDNILDYRVSAEEIVSCMEHYHTDYGNRANIVIDETPSNPQSGWFYPKYTYSVAPGINDFVSVEDSGVKYTYSKALFESYDSKETVIDIKKDDSFSLHSKTLDRDWWEKLFGGSHEGTDYSDRYKDIEAIHIVTDSDFKSTAKLTANSLYFDESDYAEFKAFYDESTADKNKDGKPDYTVVLLRYDVGKSSTLQCFLGNTNSSALVTPNIDIQSGDGYVFKQNVYLGFKVIHLALESERGCTIIPVVMSPQTVTSDSADPFDPIDPAGKAANWWIYALIISGTVTVLCVVLQIIDKKVLGEK